MLSENWIKATVSGGNGGSCVEARWVKSSASTNNGSCVEVTSTDPDNCSQCHNLPPEKAGQELILVRDSKDPQGPHLHFTLDEWRAFLDGVKKGEFDIIDFTRGSTI